MHGMVMPLVAGTITVLVYRRSDRMMRLIRIPTGVRAAIAVGGWPDATLAVTVVLALPVVGALERVSPEQVTEVARALVGRLGVGEGRRFGSALTPP